MFLAGELVAYRVSSVAHMCLQPKQTLLGQGLQQGLKEQGEQRSMRWTLIISFPLLAQHKLGAEADPTTSTWQRICPSLSLTHAPTLLCRRSWG